MTVALRPCKHTWKEVSDLILKTSERRTKYKYSKYKLQQMKKCFLAMRAHLNAAVHHGLRQSFWFHLCWIDSVEWFRVRSGKILSVILDHVANQLFKLLKCVFASHICGLRTFHQEVQCHIRCKQSSYTWAKKCHITPPKNCIIAQQTYLIYVPSLELSAFLSLNHS